LSSTEADEPLRTLPLINGLPSFPYFSAMDPPVKIAGPPEMVPFVAVLVRLAF
jgi:hypothetical protein